VDTKEKTQGVPMVTQQITLDMEATWHCGLRSGAAMEWEKRYLGRGSSPIMYSDGGNAMTAAEQRAYAQCIEKIVYAYVNDVVLHAKNPARGYR
jgi:hypothetical protein